MLYSFKLDEESKTLYTIITPFGKYQYNRLPMRIKIAPDIAQEKIEETPCGINCKLFINGIGIFRTVGRTYGDPYHSSPTFEQHWLCNATTFKYQATSQFIGAVNFYCDLWP